MCGTEWHLHATDLVVSAAVATVERMSALRTLSGPSRTTVSIMPSLAKHLHRADAVPNGDDQIENVFLAHVASLMSITDRSVNTS